MKRKGPARKTKSTLYLTEQQHRLIHNSGKTLQRFYDDLTDLYELHDMERWRDGHMFHRQTRVLFVRADQLNRLIEQLPDPYSASKELGEQGTRMFKAIWNIEVRTESGRKRFHRVMNKVAGWGVFTEPKPGRIVVESPAIVSEPFMRGYLEGLLSVELDTIENTADRIVFEIRERAR